MKHMISFMIDIACRFYYILVPPRFGIPPSNATLLESWPHVIDWQIYGVPPPIAKWTKNSVNIDASMEGKVEVLNS